MMLLGAMSIASPAAPGTLLGTAGNGGLVTGMDDYDALVIVATLTGATGGPLDVYLQTSYDDGNHWVDYVHYAQVAAAAAAASKFTSVSKYVQITNFPTVGFDGTPALAAATVVGGPWGRQMRAVLVAGALTTAGATQVVSVLGTRASSLMRG
ncbi:MAG TPA: hypothetical protein VFT22_10915 [Kofleriaceae bacterium]|nr:hypothetical protein [Kofleriaceae bacterium]